MSNEILNDARIRSEACTGAGGNSLAERGRALENAYFAKRDRELIEGLKSKDCCKSKDCGDKCGANCGSNCKDKDGCSKSC